MNLFAAYVILACVGTLAALAAIDLAQQRRAREDATARDVAAYLQALRKSQRQWEREHRE